MTRDALDSLAVRAKAGDRDAQNAVAQAVERLAYRHAHRLARTFHIDTDDLAAEGLGTILTALRHWKPERGGFANYFTFAAVRRMGRWARQQQRLTACQLFPTRSDDGPAFDPEARTDGAADLGDLLCDLGAILADFPPELREVFQRRHGLGGHTPHTMREIGEVTGFTKPVVTALLKTATAMVGDALHGGISARRPAA